MVSSTNPIRVIKNPGEYAEHIKAYLEQNNLDKTEIQAELEPTRSVIGKAYFFTAKIKSVNPSTPRDNVLYKDSLPVALTEGDKLEFIDGCFTEIARKLPDGLDAFVEETIMTVFKS